MTDLQAALLSADVANEVSVMRFPSVESLVGSHLGHLERRNIRPSTIAQRRRAIARLRRHLYPLHILDGTTEDLIGHLDRGLSAEARATEISHLRGFYRWALLEGHIDVDPTARLERPRLQPRLPRPMADGDLAMAMDLAPERIRPMLFLAAYTGLRAQDMCGLRADDLIWSAEPPLLIVRNGKGGKQRVLPIGEPLAQALGLCPRQGWLFPRHDDLPGHTPAHRVSQLCNQYLHSIGIASTLHQIRHWFGTKFYIASGRDLRATQEAMGHASPVSTAGYTWVDQSAAAEAISRIRV